MGANIKAIRARIRSVESTRHITKAMELVASSKIKRATAKMEQSRFYRSVMLDAFADLSSAKTMYSKARDASLPVLYIIVAGDRGLAGGYNNNIFRSSAVMMKENDVILPVGKRAVDYYS
ncbi:MAG: F0F1 ATP synthase subunit gamma, partial [Clostridia bacterium]|nr:F0F1 ATP synthase subunit gamma [Clostridia bacterium]